ncbi:MAG: deoxyribodipyrimidine photo-lyase [Acholeplasmataceae bacterium]|nr:deoxyribodipyrimidine photo-lyase [Acholeplasmataceae bacterium]
MNPGRLTRVKEKAIANQKQYVLYWMQQSQRVHYNHALNHAIVLANEKKLPVVVYFGLTPDYIGANRRHYQFMLEGLKGVCNLLEKLGIAFVFRIESPEKGLINLLGDADVLVMDQGYLKHQIAWRNYVINQANNHLPHLAIDVVETDVVVPVKIASQKSEYGAYTLRPKLNKLMKAYLDFEKLETVTVKNTLTFKSDDDLLHIDHLLDLLPIDQSVQPSPFFKGGYVHASKCIHDFLAEKAHRYLKSNDPSTQDTSMLSMYLHFGQISPLEIIAHLRLSLIQGHIEQKVYDAFIEQLFIRRELGFNFVTFQKGYDTFEKMTEAWAYQTMKAHEQDIRSHLYDLKQIESGQTHDSYFNAAMKEMVITGYMHNYMRMYWAKKIIEWSSSHQEAYQILVYLNNKYFIDGRDPNSYASIAWCFGKHDRPWTERPIFGKLRYLNDKGLERKFNIKGYLQRIDDLTEN